MFNKKAATVADILSYFIILLGGSVVLMGIAFFVVAPALGDRAEGSVNSNIAKFNDNIFLFNYLKYPVGDKTMADLIVDSYMEDNYALLEEETKNFITKLYSQETRVCCKLDTGILGLSTSYYWRQQGNCDIDDMVDVYYCINYRIEINDDEVIDIEYTSGKEGSVYETYIPNYYGLDPIKFKFEFY